MTLNKVNADRIEEGIRPIFAKAITIPVEGVEDGVAIYITTSGFVEKPVPDSVLLEVAARLEIDPMEIES